MKRNIFIVLWLNATAYLPTTVYGAAAAETAAQILPN